MPETRFVCAERVRRRTRSDRADASPSPRSTPRRRDRSSSRRRWSGSVSRRSFPATQPRDRGVDPQRSDRIREDRLLDERRPAVRVLRPPSARGRAQRRRLTRGGDEPSGATPAFSDVDDRLRRGGGAAGPDYPDHLDIGGLMVELSYRHDPGHPEDGVTARVPLNCLDASTRRDSNGWSPVCSRTRSRRRVAPFRSGSAPASCRSPRPRPGRRSIWIPIVVACSRRSRRISRSSPVSTSRLATFGSISRTHPDPLRGRRRGRSHARIRSRLSAACCATPLGEAPAFEAVAHAAMPDGEAQRLAAIQGRRDWTSDRFLLGPHSKARSRLSRDSSTGTARRPTHRRSPNRRGPPPGCPATPRDRQSRRPRSSSPAPAERGGSPRTLDAASSAEFADTIGDLTLQVVVDRDVDLASVRDRPSFTMLDDLVRRDLWPGLERRSTSCFRSWTRRRGSATCSQPRVRPPGPRSWRRNAGTPPCSSPRTCSRRRRGRRLERLPVYIDAGVRRIERLRGDGLKRDAPRGVEFDGWWRLYVARHEELASIGRSDPDLDAFRWLLEDYRVQLHAPERASGARVSVTQLKDAWRRIVGRPSSD